LARVIRPLDYYALCASLRPPGTPDGLAVLIAHDPARAGDEPRAIRLRYERTLVEYEKRFRVRAPDAFWPRDYIYAHRSHFTHVTIKAVSFDSVRSAEVGLSLPEGSTIGDIKSLFGSLTEPPLKNWALMFGCVLKNDTDHRIIFDFNIRRGTRLTALVLVQSSESPLWAAINSGVTLDNSVTFARHAPGHVRVTAIFETTTVLLDVELTDTASILKDRLHDATALNNARLRIVFGGSDLVGPRPLIEYGISAGAIVQVSLAPLVQGIVSLRVKTITGKVEIVSADPRADNVLDLKERIFIVTGIPTDQQMILIGERKRHLCDDEELGALGINEDTALHLELRLRGC
jgi:hypothetical protein